MSYCLPSEYFADAAVRDSELPGDVTRPDSLVSHLHNPLPHQIWKWSPVDKHPSQLVDTSVT